MQLHIFGSWAQCRADRVVATRMAMKVKTENTDPRIGCKTFRSMEQRKIRLGKASKELKVSHVEILQFLAGEGYEIENNPNSLLTGGQFKLILQHFSQQKRREDKTETNTDSPSSTKGDLSTKKAISIKSEGGILKFSVKHKIKVEQYFFMWLLLNRDWVKPFEKSIAKQYLNVTKFAFEDLDDLEERGFIVNMNVAPNTLPEFYIVSDEFSDQILSGGIRPHEQKRTARDNWARQQEEQDENEQANQDFWEDVGTDPDIY